jgi:hypothetical protein
MRPELDESRRLKRIDQRLETSPSARYTLS